MEESFLELAWCMEHGVNFKEEWIHHSSFFHINKGVRQAKIKLENYKKS